MGEIKLRRVRRLDCIRLDVNDRTYFTEEGYLVDHPILTSCGIFEYTNPDGSIRRELRLPEHVFDEKSLKTYRGKPVVITHEAGTISKDNVDKEQVGTILTDGYQDGENVRAEIIIHNTDAMRKSGLKELSLGYNLDLLDKSGEWNGEPYDAIQTNIVINHLALVASARAGEQARLNIDSSDSPELKGSKALPVQEDSPVKQHPNPGTPGSDEIENMEEGGKQVMHEHETHADSMDMTPEELVEAIKMYKASKAGDGGSASDGEPVQEGNAAAVSEGTTPVQTAEPPSGNAGTEEKHDGDIEPFIAAVEQLLSALKGGSGNSTAAQDNADSDGTPETTGDSDDGCVEDNTDGSDDMSQSLNADSADDLFRQRLSICRIGDRLNMDGLEEKSILDGKKAIIAKVLPSMRLDGKGTAYIDAAYDLAVSEVNRHKDVAYQKEQMRAGTPAREDGRDGGSMASSARQRMIDREGGKE